MHIYRTKTNNFTKKQMPQTISKPRPNKQVPITFGAGEEKLLELLDDGLKNSVFSSRSGWVKQKIREEFLF